MFGPLEKKLDYTEGGGTYGWETCYINGIPDVVDSLLAIKNICFDRKLCTLQGLLSECENNFPDEEIRQMCINTTFFGDGEEYSSKLFAKLWDDIYKASRTLPTAYGGSWKLGSYAYTEIVNWGLNIGALPNGRRAGEPVSQGFTPSRLNKIDSILSVFDSLRYFDSDSLSAGSVVNVILPPDNLTTDIVASFLRGAADSKASLLQINSVKKEDLLMAQKYPEKYGHIVVRVYGFSAKFVSLGRKYQDEFISRNFY